MIEFGLIPVVMVLFTASAIATVFSLKAARRIHIAGIAALGLLMLFVVFLFVTDNFDFNIVFSNSSSDVSIIYKLGAFFASVEGQLMGLILVMNLGWALQARLVKGPPTVIIAHTIKGKGVSFMENNPDFHGRAPNAAEVEIALKELE